jgi:hypothetical protein
MLPPSGKRRPNKNVDFSLGWPSLAKLQWQTTFQRRTGPAIHSPLCFFELETIDHLLTECNFSEAVWDKAAQTFNLHPAVLPFQKGNLRGWIQFVDQAGSIS